MAGLSRVSSVSKQQWGVAVCHPAQDSVPSHGPCTPDTVFSNVRAFRWFSAYDSIILLLSGSARWCRHGSDWRIEEAIFGGQLLCPLSK